MKGKDNRAYLVSREEWEHEVVKKRSGLYPDIYEAIDMLKTREIGARVKLPIGDDPLKKRKRLASYAHRFGIHIHTRIIGDWIFAITTPRGRNQTKGETTQHSELNNQQGAALQPSVVPYMSGGTRA
jgi:hypothetical protein